MNKRTQKSLMSRQQNMTAGHGGASGRFERYRITALEYSFILNLAGITK
jgi:oligopeptidase B